MQVTDPMDTSRLEVIQIITVMVLLTFRTIICSENPMERSIGHFKNGWMQHNYVINYLKNHFCGADDTKGSPFNKGRYKWIKQDWKKLKEEIKYYKLAIANLYL